MQMCVLLLNYTMKRQRPKQSPQRKPPAALQLLLFTILLFYQQLSSSTPTSSAAIPLPLVSAFDFKPDEYNLFRGPAGKNYGNKNGLFTTVTADKYAEIPQATITVPMHYESGSHHVYVYVGSPNPQRQTLILDTGSRFMAFPCFPCKGCGRHHSEFYYNDTQSTTHRDNIQPGCFFSSNSPKEISKGSDNSNKDDSQDIDNDNACIFQQTYLEGSSWTAKEVEDFIWLAGDDFEESVEEYMNHLAIPFVFGCQTEVTGYFSSQFADGILGMAKQGDPHSLIQTMVRAKAIDRAAFAMCLSKTGGTLSFGGSGLARPDSRALEYKQQYHIEPMYFSRVSQDHGLYSLEIYEVWVGPYCITCEDTPDQRANMAHARIMTAFHSGKGTLLDSGTTDSYFPSAAEDVFKEIWEKLVGSPLESQNKYTYEEFKTMPEVTVIFSPNATLKIPAESYMEGVPIDKNASHSNAVLPWEDSIDLTIRLYMEETQGAVLGVNAMYNYEVLYDLQENRIGFARANCGK